MTVNILMDDWRAEEPQTLKGRESALPAEFQAYEAGSLVKKYNMFPRGPKGYQKLEDWIYKQVARTAGFAVRVFSACHGVTRFVRADRRAS
jgi:hypothetical protein